MKHRLHRPERTTAPTRKPSAPPAPHTGHRSRAFTLVECLAVVAALALLACVALPVLAGTKSDSQRILCVNNLRQIGQAWAGWKNEHGDLMPAGLSVVEGGLLSNPGYAPAQDSWRHFAYLSNHLATPKPLACPADPQTQTATDWTQSSRRFIQPFGLGDEALSYTIGLHAAPDSPMEWVASDRYLEALAPENCGTLHIRALKVVAQGTNQFPAVRTGWFRSGGHEGMGNLLLNDGQVLQTTTEGLQAYLSRPVHQAPQVHILTAKKQ